MNRFSMNGHFWNVKFVDANSPKLMDRTGIQTVATTDPNTNLIYISNQLYGDFLMRVLLHELGHCAMFSFNLIEEIHNMVYPEYWIEAEEWVCNFIADYGFKIFSSAFDILGFNAWKYIPYELEKLIAA